MIAEANIIKATLEADRVTGNLSVIVVTVKKLQ